MPIHVVQQQCVCIYMYSHNSLCIYTTLSINLIHCFSKHNTQSKNYKIFDTNIIYIIADKTHAKSWITGIQKIQSLTKKVMQWIAIVATGNCFWIISAKMFLALLPTLKILPSPLITVLPTLWAGLHWGLAKLYMIPLVCWPTKNLVASVILIGVCVMPKGGNMHWDCIVN